MNPLVFALPVFALGFFMLARFAETKDDKAILTLLGALLIAVFALAVLFPP